MKAPATILVLVSLAVETLAWKPMMCGSLNWKNEICYDENDDCTAPRSCWNVLFTRWCSCPNSSKYLECLEDNPC